MTDPDRLFHRLALGGPPPAVDTLPRSRPIGPIRLTFEAISEAEFDDFRLLWFMCSPPWSQALEIGQIVASALFGWLP